MKRIFYTLSLIALTVSGNAQSLLVEEFNYGTTTGDLTTISSGAWVAHGGAATNPVPYALNSLSISGYGGTTAGGSANMTHGSGTREDVNRAISTKITAGTVYASAIFSVTNSGTTTADYFMHLTDTFGVATAFTAKSNNFKGRLFIRQGSAGATSFNIGLTKGSTAAASINWSGDYTVGATYALVLRYTIIAGASNDSVALYVFSGSIPATEPTSATVLASDNTTITDLTSVDAICLRQGSAGTSTTNIDAIRVGLTWASAPLPVKYTSFSAAKSNAAHLLRWSTASESNNSHFEIQRSDDGRTFEAIGKVKGSGNSNKSVNYSFTDKEAATSKTIYYRLKQVDFDGKAEYSKTVSVANTIAKAGIGATLPNPFNSDLNVTVNASSATTANVVIMDMIGKVHHTSTEQLQSGANTISINTTDMPDGIYFVRVSYNGETYTQKVVKK